MKSDILEKFLNDKLVKWTYIESVPLEQFDEKSSLRNQARFEPIHEDVVVRYTEGWERGDQFPATVGTRAKNDQIVLLDGNHRFQSKKRAAAKEDTGVTADLDCYVVQASPEVLQVITFSLNALHGMPPSVEERQRHAIYLIDNGASHESAAATTGLTKGQVQSAWNAERAERRARSLGITRGWNRLSKTQRERLAGISSDAGFQEAARLVIDSHLTGQDTIRLTSSLRNLRSDVAQTEQIKVFKEEIIASRADDKPNLMKADARRGLIPHLGYLIQMDIEAITNATITFQQAEDMLRRIADSKAALELIEESIKKRHADG